MQSLEKPQAASCKLKYTITPNDEGLLLCIWEPAQLSDNRTRPFLFMAKHQLISASMVPEVLNYYLDADR